MQPEWTWDDIADGVVPRSDVVELCLDGTVQRQLEDARRRLQGARGGDDSLASGTGELSAEVERLEAQATEATVAFTIEAIPHTQWRDLLTEHRSNKSGERYDPETFVPAAIAACCPQFTSAEQVAQAAASKLTTGQISKLFGKVRELNEGDDRVPFSHGR